MMGRVAFSMISIVCWAALPAAAQSIEARLYHGTFRDADVVLTLTLNDADESYAGTLAKSGQTFVVPRATTSGTGLNGVFRVNDGAEYPFSCEWRAGRIAFQSGSASHTLVPDPPPAMPNFDDDPDAAVIRQIDEAVSAKEYARAQELIRPLAAKGHPRGIFLQGVMHYQGWATPQDLAAARRMYRRAATLGFARGLQNLGLAYKAGDRAPQNFAAARSCFEDGVRLGSAQCAIELGVLHVNGQGVPRDYVRGYAYYLLSNTEHARKNMAELEQKAMKPDDVQAAQRLAEVLRVEYYPQSNAQAAEPFPIQLVIDSSGRAVVKTKPTASGFESVEPGDVLTRLNDHRNIGVVTPDQLKQMIAESALGSMLHVEFRRGDSNIQVMKVR